MKQNGERRCSQWKSVMGPATQMQPVEERYGPGNADAASGRALWARQRCGKKVRSVPEHKPEEIELQIDRK